MSRTARPRGTSRALGALSSSALVSAVASSLTLVLLARILGVQQLGALAVAQALAALGFAVLDLRVEDALMYKVPRLKHQRRGGAALDVARRAVRLDLMAAGAAAVLLLALSSIVPLPSGVTAMAAALAVLQQAARAGLGTATALHLLTDGAGPFAVVTGAASVVALPVTVGAAYFYGAEGFLLADSALGLLTVAVLQRRGLRRIRSAYPATADTVTAPERRAFRRFAIVSSFSGTWGAVVDSGPVLLLGLTASAEAAGLWRVALAPSRLVSTASSPFVALAQPRLADDLAAGRPNDALKFMRQWVLRTFIATCLLVAIAAVTFPALIPGLYGDNYTQAALPAVLLLAAAGARAVTGWSKVLPVALGRPGIRTTALIVEASALCVAAALIPSLLALAAAFLVVNVALSIGWGWLAHRIVRSAPARRS